MQCDVIDGFSLDFHDAETANDSGAHSFLPSTSPSPGRLSSNSSRPATATPATARIRTLQMYYGLRFSIYDFNQSISLSCTLFARFLVSEFKLKKKNISNQEKTKAKTNRTFER